MDPQVDRLQNQLDEQSRRCDALAQRIAEQEKSNNKRYAANDIKQILLDGADALLLTEEQLGVIESWEVETSEPSWSPMVPHRIRKAQEYDDVSWDGLAELIRKRQAARNKAEGAA